MSEVESAAINPHATTKEKYSQLDEQSYNHITITAGTKRVTATVWGQELSLRSDVCRTPSSLSSCIWLISIKQARGQNSLMKRKL